MERRVLAAEVDLARFSTAGNTLLGVKPVFTPTGELILVASPSPSQDSPIRPRTLLFFDARTGELTRKTEITLVNSGDLDRRVKQLSFEAHAMAVSNDGRIVALGITRDERQGFVHLFDAFNGREVGRVFHPPVKPERKDPFRPLVGYLGFSSNDKYLVSSTYDTRIWQLVRVTPETP